MSEVGDGFRFGQDTSSKTVGVNVDDGGNCLGSGDVTRVKDFPDAFVGDLDEDSAWRLLGGHVEGGRMQQHRL